MSDIESSSHSAPPRPRLPDWIRVRAKAGGSRGEVERIVAEGGLHTVCQSARCPNLGECWHNRTATFMILGNVCTRNCGFCAVTHGQTSPLDPDEPRRVAEAAKAMDLRYVVVTSVTRDDLPDGGAGQFAAVVAALRAAISRNVMVEVLVPDFKGDPNAIRTVLDSNPTVFNHNIETVERLSPQVRPHAIHQRSLAILKAAYEITEGRIPTKSGVMVGLGETDDEVVATLRQLRDNNVTMLTIGQYLPPTNASWPLDRYVRPEVFDEWKRIALGLGFTNVASGPLVRSSYHAEELASPAAF